MSRRNLVGLVALSLFAIVAPMVEANSADLRIRLTGAGGKGSAKYRDRGGVREFEVEMENLRVPVGSIVHVRVNGVIVGSATVTAFHTARLSRSTQRRNAVPTIGKGSNVAVLSSTGAVLMSGSF